MKVSSITTALQKPAKRLLPLAIGAMALAGCQSPLNNKIQVYCEGEGKSQIEYEKITKTQSGLDSLVYRDIFNATNLANDSTAIADFNKIANKTRSYYTSFEFLNATKEANISAKEYSEISKNGGNRLIYDCEKFLYTKFFKDNGLMPQVSDKLEKAYMFLKPLNNKSYDETMGRLNKERTERNILNISSIDENGARKNIVNISVTENK